MNGDYIFDNPQSPMVQGFRCDKCGTPCPPEDLVEQDGYLINKYDGCLRRHSIAMLDSISAEDDDDFPIKSTFGGTDWFPPNIIPPENGQLPYTLPFTLG
jgi:hypothetical protein